MGGGVSARSFDGIALHALVAAEASSILQHQSMDENAKTILAILDAAYAAGMDMGAIQAHVSKLVDGGQRRVFPWAWSPGAAAAVSGDSLKVEGFSHLELCIYREAQSGVPFVDGRFQAELDELFSAFFRETNRGEHPLEIVEVKAVHNTNLEESIASSTLKILEQVALGGAYGAHWKEAADADEFQMKQQVLRVMGTADPSACVLGFAGQANPQLCNNICSNGFADLAKTDPGYFGRGVYLTTHSEYAALYACSRWGWKAEDGSWHGADIKGSINDIAAGEEFTLLAAYATPGYCYPITRRADYTQSFCWCDLKGQGMKFGYHSHAVLVNRLRVLREMNYQSMNTDADPARAYGELVVQQTGQALPRYVLRCRRRDDSAIVLGASAYKRQAEPEIIEHVHKDMQALVQFFEDTNGLNWKLRTNWAQSTDLSSWLGPHYPVGLSAGGFVDRLRLPSNNICGIFSNSIATLDMLRILDLSENKLIGSVPAALGGLRHLEELYIDKNGLFGQLPGSLILKKSSLGRKCRIGGQRAVGGESATWFSFSSEWGRENEEERTRMVVDGCLGEVTKLALGDSSIGGPIPAGMLRYFAQALGSDNDDSMRSHPAELKEIDMAKNAITGAVPAEIGLLTALIRIDLSSNMLTGHVPVEIAQLRYLVDLNLSSNCLCGEFPLIIAKMTELKNLNLSGNQLEGIIPDVFNTLVNLIRLELGHNKFTGELPPSLCNLTGLILLSCEYNLLSGGIPSSYGGMVSLRGLNLSSNKFSGEFPTKVAELTTLQRLEIANNEFSGNLPIFAANQKLRIINVASNSFRGSIPEEWRLLTSLETVFLNGNPDLKTNGAADLLGQRVEIML